jgi:hypothetical protein
MIENREPLKDRKQTARRIKHLVEQFYLDLKNVFWQRDNKLTPLSDLTLQEYFNFIKDIPYRKDPRPFEIVARPYYIFKHLKLGMDCKKKGTAIAAFLRLKNYKYRAIGSSSRPDHKVHHIYFQYFDPKTETWKNADATYSHYRLDEEKKNETYKEVLK